MSRALDTFHRLPYPARVGVAAARGAWLAWWRYGAAGDRAAQDVAARDRWSADRLAVWQEVTLAEVLAGAARDVAAHRRSWAGSGADPTDLARWPVLTKERLRVEGQALVIDDAPRRLYRNRSSGTTGTPVAVWSSRSEVQRWYAAHEQRLRRWHGVSRHERWAILGGQLVAPPGRAGPPWWVWSPTLHQLYLSSAHVGPEHAVPMAAALRRFAPTHIVAYPSALAHLARSCLDVGVALPRLTVAISNAEPLTDEQRSVIGAAFRCPVRDSYGQSEMLVGASECEHGTLHVWSDVGVVEVLDDDDRPVPGGEVGRLVVTSLLHRTMPLVRCDTGDRGRAPTPTSCACGRALPALGAIEGRSSDAVLTADGRRVFWLNPVFAELPLREAQVEQRSLGSLVVRVVPDGVLDATTRDELVARLRGRVGPMDVEVVAVDAIERGPGGKLRPVVSRLDV